MSIKSIRANLQDSFPHFSSCKIKTTMTGEKNLNNTPLVDEEATANTMYSFRRNII
jgi:hypothetical protein